MGYTTLLFDLDHTLFDTDTSEVLAFNSALRSVGVDDPSVHFDDYRRINGELWAAVERGEVAPIDVRSLRFARLIDERDIDADVEELASAFVTGLGAHGELYPGALDVLAHLAGVARLALVTNGLGDVQRARHERVGFADYFDAIVISSEVGVTKPRPEIFDITFEQLGAPAGPDALMIGDSLTSDIKGGSGYGIATCWYNPHGKPSGADDVITHQIANLDELITLCEMGPAGPI